MKTLDNTVILLDCADYFQMASKYKKPRMNYSECESGLGNKSETVTVLPSPDELSSICNVLKCSEENCSSVFKCSSNLNMHLIKHHKIADGLQKKGLNVQFACPIESCKYGLKSNRHFKKRKYLKQHYLKCHAKRENICGKCKKGFPTSSMLVAHEKTCGINYVCSCGWTYTSKEALMTHCKRKQHKPLESSIPDISTKRDSIQAKNNVIVENGSKNIDLSTAKVICPCGLGRGLKDKKQNSMSEEEDVSAEDDIKMCDSNCGNLADEKVEENTVVKVCIASPPHAKSPRKPSSDFAVVSTHYVAAIALSELSTTFIFPKNIGVQTVDNKILKKNRSPASDKKRKNSQETQTAGTTHKCKRQKKSAETQTVSHVKRKCAIKNIPRKRKKSTETQTKDLMPFFSSASNESLDAGIFNESSLSNSSSTNNEGNQKSNESVDDETTWNPQNFNSTDSKQTSNPYITTINSSMFDLNKELTIDSSGGDHTLSHFNSFDKLCNIETQTEIDALLQSDTEETSTIETQTTEDSFDDLLYSNMCTQTCDDVCDLFDFSFVDIETQTAWPDL